MKQYLENVSSRRRVVGTATLWAVRSEDRMPVGWRFSVPVQASPGASYTTETESLPGTQRPGRGVNHPSPSSARVKEIVELYPTPPLGLHGLF
jgi:hypothetical protein